jgi:hypothetical protein
LLSDRAFFANLPPGPLHVSFEGAKAIDG